MKVRTFLYPSSYTIGLDHNNCSGGCIRAGLSHWASLLKLRPDVYADRERMEEEWNRDILPTTRNAREDSYTILRMGGHRKSGEGYISLRDFRLLVESGKWNKRSGKSDSKSNIPCICEV